MGERHEAEPLATLTWSDGHQLMVTDGHPPFLCATSPGILQRKYPRCNVTNRHIFTHDPWNVRRVVFAMPERFERECHKKPGACSWWPLIHDSPTFSTTEDMWFLQLLGPLVDGDCERQKLWITKGASLLHSKNQSNGNYNRVKRDYSYTVMWIDKSYSRISYDGDWSLLQWKFRLSIFCQFTRDAPKYSCALLVTRAQKGEVSLEDILGYSYSSITQR